MLFILFPFELTSEGAVGTKQWLDSFLRAWTNSPPLQLLGGLSQPEQWLCSQLHLVTQEAETGGLPIPHSKALS